MICYIYKGVNKLNYEQFLIVKFNRSTGMFWCYNCSTTNSCSQFCQGCRSQALEQVTVENDPKNFTPFLIQQQKEEPLYSLQSLYRSMYSGLFEAIRQRRPQAIRTVNTDEDYRVSYVIVIDPSQNDTIRGLNQEEINQIQKKIVSNECSICQQVRESAGFMLECKHEFHEQCLLPWFKTNGSCPTCRYNLIKQ